MHPDMEYVETIRISKGRVRHIRYHQDRFDATRREVYGSSVPRIKLRSYIQPPSKLSTIKCRILYAEEILDVQYYAYEINPITSLRAVEVGNLSYRHKAVDRAVLDSVMSSKGRADDVLMIKHGLITDTHYGNVALEIDGKWYTPKEPLLAGTMRAFLLDRQQVLKAELTISDIGRCSTIRVFNAMIPFGSIELSPSQVLLD